jgi:hypothetical protein
MSKINYTNTGPDTYFSDWCTDDVYARDVGDRYRFTYAPLDTLKWEVVESPEFFLSSEAPNSDDGRYHGKLVINGKAFTPEEAYHLIKFFYL